jgi:hypothetical protein
VHRTLRPPLHVRPRLRLDPPPLNAPCLQSCTEGHPRAPRRFEGDRRHATGRQPVSPRVSVSGAGANTPHGGARVPRGHRHLLGRRSDVQARRVTIDRRPWRWPCRSGRRRTGGVGRTAGPRSRPHLQDMGTGSGRGSCRSAARCHTGAGPRLSPWLATPAPGAIRIHGPTAPRSHRPHPTRGLPLRLDPLYPSSCPLYGCAAA